MTAAATVTAMAAQPTVNVKGGTDTSPSSGLVVNVKLTYHNVAFVPANLLTALLTQYGAGKVASSEDTVALQEYAFDITP